MMVALLLYGYARGVRSSRRIERACVEDVSFRVVAANQAPDHTTIARFRQRHEAALAGLFGDVLELCAEAGLVEVGVVAIDGTRVHANAGRDANTKYEDIAKEILAEADAGRPRGGRALGRRVERGCVAGGVSHACWAQGLVARGKPAARGAPRNRGAADPEVAPGPLAECKRRLEEDLAVERGAVERQAEFWAAGVAADGKRLGRRPNPYTPPETPAGRKINTSDPDSRRLKAPQGYLQGYNAQAAVTDNQVVVAAEVNAETADFGHLEPMVNAALGELDAAGVTDTPEVVVADAGYWHSEQMDAIVNRGIQVIVPPDAAGRKTPRPGWDGGRYAFMRKSARNRGRRRALPKTPRHDRTRLRRHEVQPPHRPLLTPRTRRRPVGMANDHRDPQPDEAPPPLDPDRRDLRRGPDLTETAPRNRFERFADRLRNSHGRKRSSAGMPPRRPLLVQSGRLADGRGGVSLLL